MNIYPRVSGRVGEIVALNMNFYHNRVLSSPFAIRRIDIFRASLKPEDLVAQVVFPSPVETAYPAPGIEINPGMFEVNFAVPETFVPNDAYFDVWYFIGEDPGTAGFDNENLWNFQTGQFWLFDDVWVSDDELLSKRLGFEPLDKKFKRGEIRNLEIGIHPLPKYDYDFNKIAPIIPQLSPSITVWTIHDELLLSDVPCKIGVRQGHHRNSPFVIQCLLDTRTLIRGTYRYVVKVNIGRDVIISDKFHFVVL